MTHILKNKWVLYMTKFSNRECFLSHVVQHCHLECDGTRNDHHACTSLLIWEGKRIRCNTARLQGFFWLIWELQFGCSTALARSLYHMTVITLLSQLKLHSISVLLFTWETASSYNDFQDSHDWKGALGMKWSEFCHKQKLSLAYGYVLNIGVIE